MKAGVLEEVLVPSSMVQLAKPNIVQMYLSTIACMYSTSEVPIACIEAQGAQMSVLNPELKSGHLGIILRKDSYVYMGHTAKSKALQHI